MPKLRNNGAHARHGLTLEQYVAHRDSGALLAYARQKDTAKSRGIEWLFTFTSWWRMWEDSGKWELRGRTKGLGGWEMSRPGDVGPYSPANVVIVPHRVNMADVNATLAARRHAAGLIKRPRVLVGRYSMQATQNVQRAAQLLEAGCSFTEIGKVLGIHRSNVKNALVRNGLLRPSDKSVAG